MALGANFNFKIKNVAFTKQTTIKFHRIFRIMVILDWNNRVATLLFTHRKYTSCPATSNVHQFRSMARN